MERNEEVIVLKLQPPSLYALYRKYPALCEDCDLIASFLTDFSVYNPQIKPNFKQLIYVLCEHHCEISS